MVRKLVKILMSVGLVIAVDPAGGSCSGAMLPFDDCDLDRQTITMGDCDDNNPMVHLAAIEPCSSTVDLNCDGVAHNDAGPVDRDEDNDGFFVGTNCHASGPPDCDDSAPSIFPGAPEVCGDGIDQNCNGWDWAPTCMQPVVGSPDVDDDGDGSTENEGDCDDSNPGLGGATGELCDGRQNLCGGTLPLDEVDADSDGFFACQADCDDQRASVSPGQSEICDSHDNDCDGTREVDVDGDGVPDCGESAGCASDASCTPVELLSFTIGE